MVVEKIYLNDSYAKEFEATVLKVEDKGGNICFVILDRTAFHPTAGGQPHDTGFIIGLNGKMNVTDVYEDDSGNVIHEGVVEGSIAVGDKVRGQINWDRRYRLMRMHTAAHILIQAVRDYFRSPVRCVSAGKSLDRGRLDFQAKISREMLPEIESIANSVVSEDRRVIIKYMAPSDAVNYLKKYHESIDLYARKYALPEKIRIIEIEGWYAIPCGGTHVKRTGEVGRIKLLKRASKGKGVVRIEYTVEP
ncbi:MAG: alanyl-tRNA editing protein [archaeon GB-1867-005]|nr:alanyl-tRNA editing protein [Candidatus Culexmicrobium cathedralense]